MAGPSRLLARLRPRSIAGQIALLVVAAIVVAHAVATVAFVLLREPWRPDDHPGVAANRLATVLRLAEAAPPAERPALIAHAGAALPSLRIRPWPAGEAGGELEEHPVLQRLRDGFGSALILSDLGSGSEGGRDWLRIGVATPSGTRLQAVLPDEALRSPRQGAVIFTALVLALTLALLFVWAARALTEPLARLARSAESFGVSGPTVPPPQQGPREVLAVSGALERMGERVRRLIDDRTQMLAAVSHDLRTPITRMRLRAEFIEDEHARAVTLRDLAQMNALVEAALSFVRDGQSGGSGETSLLDLASLVQTVCDGFSDMGAEVSVAESRHVLVRGRPEELERAVTNLVDNAVKYGGRAEIAVTGTPERVAVEVLDRGPGIPEAEREAMLQPFVRGDRSRNQNAPGGFGLGLSIVLAIAETHGGRLVLANRPGGGLCARLELPAAAGQGRPPSARSEPGGPLSQAAE
ncbi:MULTISPECIES: ATP-binding protein [Methylobacterium]|nr:MULTISPECIES: ATP-binding protein [Methylobacterium]PIU07602.1 MAG: two-component sensor histidine kinase [Methylobacterium sp. CG09_land_8_20_14_0_10_71_15]PIU16228.1 MAG: two-component sensor histidine kinase [Methylobacterium sp. CG08_land_8_20_14_0_20_71_15]